MLQKSLENNDAGSSEEVEEETTFPTYGETVAGFKAVR
jgi:hypothetical protein